MQDEGCFLIRGYAVKPSRLASQTTVLTRCGLVAVLCAAPLVSAAELVGLPYTTVGVGQPRTQIGIDYIETQAEPMPEPEMVEIAPDPYSREYRSGVDVYKAMGERSFDDEPMLVVYPAVDPAMAPPEIVVTPASIEVAYTHITPAQQIIDPIAQGEDAIFLLISSPPEPPSGAQPLEKPSRKKQRRFFSQPVY